MTALISAMNKKCIALAADSAVTIDNGSGHKVINCADKLFVLSDAQPIAVMTCGNAEYMAMPWEVIIKEYRVRNGAKVFPTLADCKNDFIDFILTNGHFCSVGYQLQHLISEVNRLLMFMLKDTDSMTDAQRRNHVISVIDGMINRKANPKEGLVDLTVDKFKAQWGADIDAILAKHAFFVANPDLIDRFIECFVRFIRDDDSNHGYTKTQIVLAGFGRDEFMPRLLSFNVHFGFGDYLMHDSYIEQTINESNSAAISRFAQTDIINTFINGIHPTLTKSLTDTMPALLNKILEQISGEFTDSVVKDKIKNFDTSRAVQLFSDLLNRESRDKFANPLVNTLVSLDKTDMAEFAESLIALTSLNRRVTGAEEGVGGPVDVVIITKSDGVVWMRHKSFINPALNPRLNP